MSELNLYYLKVVRKLNYKQKSLPATKEQPAGFSVYITFNNVSLIVKLPFLLRPAMY